LIHFGGRSVLATTPLQHIEIAAESSNARPTPLGAFAAAIY
jgi:hypothetical protein